MPTASEDGAGYEVGAEGGEDRQVQQAGRGHHRRVVALLQCEPGEADQPDRRDRARDPDPAEQAVVAVAHRRVQHLHHAGRPEEHGQLERPHDRGPAHEILHRVAPQARLHEIPVAEQHRVADRAEERGADEQPQRGEQVRTAGEHRRREQAELAQRGRDEIERGRELRVTHVGGRVVGCATDHRRDPGPPVGAQLHPAAHPRAPSHHGDRERDRREHHDADRGREREAARDRQLLGREQRRRADRHHAVDAAQQPAVAEAHLAPARRDPQEREPARRPLQQERRAVELHGAPSQSTTARSRGALLRRLGPASVATTMSSSRMPNRPSW